MAEKVRYKNDQSVDTGYRGQKRHVIDIGPEKRERFFIIMSTYYGAGIFVV
jgi:hypothetical protein